MLEAKHLHFQYKGASRIAVNDVSLTVQRGEVLGLIGPNGAGKSTLASVLMGLRKPQRGSVLFEGEPLRAGRSELAIVPQEYAFYHRLTLLENLQFFARLCESDSLRRGHLISEVIASCDLSRFVHQRAEHCSGGEKRRLNIALSLLKKPALILLDEPTASVDPLSRELIVMLIRSLNQQGTTILYTSHLLTEVEMMCDRIALMHQGQLLYQGPTADIHSASNSQLTVIVNGDGNDQVFATLPLQDRQGKRLRFTPNLSAADVSIILDTLRGAGFGFANIDLSRGTLEDFFLSLVRESAGDTAPSVNKKDARP